MKLLKLQFQQDRDGFAGSFSKCIFIIALFTTLFTFSSSISFSQDIKNNSGPLKLQTISVSTLKGEVYDIRVPNNIQPGDNITGSIVSAKSSSTLKGAVVEIQDKQSKLADKFFEIIVPMGATSIPFLLKNSNGKAIANATIPVNSTPLPTGPGNTPIPVNQLPKPVQTSPGNFAPMNYAQPGQPLNIPGNFDGNAANTSVSINNVPCEIIAESPRGTIVQVPEGLNAGRGTVNINERGVTQSMPIQVVTINLSTNTPTILKSSTTKIDCQVKGLENLDLEKNNFKVVLTNQSPQTIALTGGNTQINHELTGGNVQNGTTGFSVEATGITSGNFTVNATLSSNTCKSCWDAYLNCLARSDAEEKRCNDDCDKNNGGWACKLACWTAARKREVICWTEYLDCVRKKFGY